MRFKEFYLKEASQEYNIVKFFSDKVGKFLDYFQKNVEKFDENKVSPDRYTFDISDIVKEVNDKTSMLYSMRNGTIDFVKWKKAYNSEPIVKLITPTREVSGKGFYSYTINKIIIPYLDFKQEGIKDGYPWVDKIKSTLVHEMTHKFQKVSGKEITNTTNLSRKDWLKSDQELEAILNQMYKQIQDNIKRLFRLLDSTKKEYFKTKDNEFKWEYIDFSNQLYRIFKSEESFEKEFYGNDRYKESLSRAKELNDIDKSIMKEFLEKSYYDLLKEFENVYPEKKIVSKMGNFSFDKAA